MKSDDFRFRSFLAREGAALQKFALHQALSDQFGPYWTHWPAPYQDPNSPACKAFEAQNPGAIQHHAWLQFLAREQLEKAGENPLYLDLAVGTHPEGAETWMEPSIFIPQASLGAPPDPFSPGGQRWNLAGFSPQALEAADFRPFAQTLATQMTPASHLRIDHILGFERSFLVPPDAPGAYISMPREALLAVTRIEAARAGCHVIGEDLGNVPPGLRNALKRSGILGCRIMMFETAPPATYPAASLASFATHDLPTWAGWRKGADISARAALSGEDPAPALTQRKSEAAALTAITGGPTADDLHRTLAASGSALVAVQIEDALGLTEQMNLPGTVHEYPNWRHRLPVPAKALSSTPGLKSAASIMNKVRPKEPE